MTDSLRFSIVIPAKNESFGLKELLPKLAKHGASEIIVVDDGSTDDTSAVAKNAGAIVVKHPKSRGNGAAIKAGVRQAKQDIVLFMDADGQHDPENIPRLLEEFAKGYEMVVGSRSGQASQASLSRGVGNYIYNKFASWITNFDVKDLTSGFRVVRKSSFERFLYMLPNGFSYPTTSTLAFLRSGLMVSYVDVFMPKRVGSSHISIWKDGIKFFLIIFKIGTLYSPLKVFLPFSIVHFLLGLFYYCFTFFSYGTFTNMSALLLSTSVVIFLMGLLSEQVSLLLYKDT